MIIADAGFRIDSRVTLDRQQVHLWRVDLAATISGAEQWSSILSSDERTRAARFHFPKDRLRFIAARAVLRRILGAYLDIDPRAVIFTYSPEEKPGLAEDQAKSGVSFNISHSGKIALLAFARSRDVGVDVEQHRPEIETTAIARRFFSSAEQLQLADLPADKHREAFFLCWSRKEAYIKATGKGMSLPLRDFDVSLAPNDQNALVATRPNPNERDRWSLRDIPVESGYAAALCVTGIDWTLVDGIEQERER